MIFSHDGVKSHVKQQMSWLYFHKERGKIEAGILLLCSEYYQRYQKEFQRGLAFTIFIRIWVTFETVELTKGKECRSQVKSVKIWTWQGMNEGTPTAWEKGGWTGILVIFKAIWHYLSMRTDWYQIRQGRNPVKGTQLSGAAASYNTCRKPVS